MKIKFCNLKDELSGEISVIEVLIADRPAFLGNAENADNNWRGYPGIASAARFN